MKAMASFLRRYLLPATAVTCAGTLGMASASAGGIYANTLAFDGATVGIYIRTDGTMGPLATWNITSWNINITDGAGSVDLTPLDSRVEVFGYALSATPTELDFWFISQGLVLFEETPPLTDGPFFCAGSQSEPCFDNTGGLAASTQDGESPIDEIAESDVIALAPVQQPEPGTLAIFGAGLLAVGFVILRRRRRF